MTFADLISNLIESSRERIKNPLFSSISFSFFLYNWRPISFFLLSDLPVEDRIVVINKVYCYPLAILLPILFGVIYTNYVPMLMVYLDKNLEETKKEKVTNLYTYKDHRIGQQISLAKKEFELKNIENGNKDREEMIKEKNLLKKELEITKQELIEANEGNGKIVQELTSQINTNRESLKNLLTSNSKEAKELSEENRTLINSLRTTNGLMPIFMALNHEDILILSTIRNNSMIEGLKNPRYSTYSSKSIKKLLEYNLIQKEQDGDYSLTSLGTRAIEKVDELDLLF